MWRSAAPLREALSNATFTLVYGPPGSGKSRSAFEGVLKRHPEARLLVPEDASALKALTAVPPRLDPEPNGVVLWLDCLGRFLDGLSLDALLALAIPGKPFRVLATINEDELRELIASSGQHGHTVRRFLARAKGQTLAGAGAIRWQGPVSRVRSRVSA